METHLVFGFGLGLTAVFASLGGLLLLTAFQGQRTSSHPSIFDDRQTATVFLFDGDVLVDCTPAGRAVLAASSSKGCSWTRLLAHLGTTFPDIEQHLARLEEEGAVTLATEATSGTPLLMLAEQRGGLTRIALVDMQTDTGLSGPVPGLDPLIFRAMSDELAFARGMLAQAPILAWRERADGAVIWANAAYLLRATDMVPDGQDFSWPLPRLFERTASQQGAAGQRQQVRLRDGTTVWFDLFSAADDTGRRVFALPADAAVQAETTLRDFMQTLTKTFAHLSIGLAIFDSNRCLQMFNPALLDLTGLPADFLSTRPSLVAVLDAMRDNSMVSEPKDYRSWRQQITDLERAAASGRYEETWNLPGGQTYKVIGRPHPNGALALIIEDISTEISRTRRYRAELELGQSVIDALDEAVCVFSQTGLLVMTNAAYAKLWLHDPAEAVSAGGISSVSSYWRSQTAPSALWADVEEFVATAGDRSGWSADARLLDGRMIHCRFAPLAGGATLVGFRVVQSKQRVHPASPAMRLQAR